jgi:hypothetical protein
MAAARLSWLARNGRTEVPHACAGWQAQGKKVLAARHCGPGDRGSAVLWQLKPSRRYGSQVPQPLRRRRGGYRLKSTRAGADRAKKRKYARTDRRTTHRQRRPSADCVYAEIMPRSKVPRRDHRLRSEKSVR